MNKSNALVNYVPCVEMEKLSESQPEETDVKDTLPPPVERLANPEKLGDNNAAWRRNYVPCVEADRLWGRTDATDCRQEIQLQPGHIQQPSDTVVHMYTFGPVSTSQGLRLVVVRRHPSFPVRSNYKIFQTRSEAVTSTVHSIDG